ncbi:hypothetical protein HU200_003518 [Digitaria exilis]|uniref:Uncharacterized protein n=1 Tax=Digitaria exilis TaxID=1010633 RepID=A0A835FTT6_9POAL|nr:hypothetical protein HU200_003518 [Digitaria exilis]
MANSGAPFAHSFANDNSVLDMIDSKLLGRAPDRFTPGGWCLGSSKPNWTSTVHPRTPETAPVVPPTPSPRLAAPPAPPYASPSFHLHSISPLRLTALDLCFAPPRLLLGRSDPSVSLRPAVFVLTAARLPLPRR